MNRELPYSESDEWDRFCWGICQLTAAVSFLICAVAATSAFVGYLFRLTEASS